MARYSGPVCRLCRRESMKLFLKGEKCLTKCDKDADCPYFNSCQSGACVKTGCKTDRECAMYTRDARAVCASGLCGVPCTSDLECNNGSSGLTKCQSGACVFVGSCDPDPASDYEPLPQLIRAMVAGV